MPDLAGPIEHVKGLFEGDELLPKPDVHPEYETVRQNLQDIEDKLADELEKAKKMFKCPSIVYKDSQFDAAFSRDAVTGGRG